jgi:hypothetical protein
VRGGRKGHEQILAKDHELTLGCTSPREKIEYIEKFWTYADLPFDWIVTETSKNVGKD